MERKEGLVIDNLAHAISWMVMPHGNAAGAKKDWTKARARVEEALEELNGLVGDRG